MTEDIDFNSFRILFANCIMTAVNISNTFFASICVNFNARLKYSECINVDNQFLKSDLGTFRANHAFVNPVCWQLSNAAEADFLQV
jgi:hypothetical protein